MTILTSLFFVIALLSVLLCLNLKLLGGRITTTTAAAATTTTTTTLLL